MKFDVNFNGRHVLHSGFAGTQFKIWTIVQVSESAAVLALELADGEGGFPGNRHVEARFETLPPAPLPRKRGEGSQSDLGNTSGLCNRAAKAGSECAGWTVI